MVCFKLRLATFYVHKISLLAYKQTFLDSSVTRWNDRATGVIPALPFPATPPVIPAPPPPVIPARDTGI